MITELLNLDRPLIVLDVETHAFTQPQYIVEIGFEIIYPVKDNKSPATWVSYIHPPDPITLEATEKHHITNEMVQDAPKWNDVAVKLAKGFSHCDFAGYNLKTFDLPVIASEMARVDVEWSYAGARILDGLALWRIGQPRTLSDAMEVFCQRKTTDAHRALGDAQDARDAIKGILLYFSQLPRDIQELHDLCFPTNPNYIDPEGKFIWKGSRPFVNFGKKYNGRPMELVPKNFYEWMLTGSFSREVQKICLEAITGKYPIK